ncbi:MAG: hypothetical protein ACE5D6_01430 [Candidatus Zixiibacteriota bacterium]
MTRIIPYILYFWLIAMHQVILKDVTSIFGISINLAVLIIVLATFYKSELVVCWFSFLIGLIAYTADFHIIGWQVVMMVIIGFIAFHIKEKLNLDSLYAKLLLIFGGVLFHNIISLVLSNSDQFFYLFLSKAITGAIYTTIIAWFFFLFKEGKITFQKFKSIF